ncbi:FHA domain-containing protein [Paenibacillus pinisoli]|uniref:FHA domain-containing protein n=1 Tax=Paenibacillus pinisoli TaxID=1276110 RepID=A0A3A6PQE9_9BACL|nr:DUF6382 domain-containing protein [Paenibacillus pinisoli]RJX41658.1 FHA domain-containing protein [Paenibacillus pinisoli]
MRRLRMDFAMNRGHEMTIDREEGISRSELDGLELQMLRSQRIPYLLPLDWYELDGSITFRYALTGHKMMIHRLQQEMLTMEQYYSLILALTDALLECREYMLRPEGCLLNEQYMFMGERFGDLKLVYVPFKDIGEDRHCGEALLSLAVRWTSYVEHIDGTGLKRILQLLQHNRASLAELRETLLDLIAKASPAIHRTAEYVQPRLQGAERSRGSAPYAPHAVSQSSSAQLKQHFAAEAEPQATLSLFAAQASSMQGQESFSDQKRGLNEIIPSRISQEEEISWSDEEEEDDGHDEEKGRSKWVAGAAFLLVTACIWRFLYMDHPTRQNLLISSGLTLFAVAGFIMFSKRGSSLLMTKKEPSDAEEDFEPHSSVFPSRFSWSKQPLAAALEPLPATTESMGSYSVPAPQRAADPAPRTNLPATTLISSNNDDSSSHKTVTPATGAQSASLSRTWNGKEDQIAFASDSFRIGRSGDGAGYEEQTEGISRLHLEIERINGVYHAKDLGSRNGSLLNGKLMVPYKAYKLEFGDRIQLAGDKGPIYELKRG